MAQQVKSKQRVADHGEVFTAEREVKAMVDLVWDNFTDHRKIEATYLEPACGSGNFLVEILERKLLLVKKEKNQNEFQKKLITALTSIYGVELLPDNAEECRERLYRLAVKHYPPKYKKSSHYAEMLKNIRYILSQNIICGNALDYTTSEGTPIIFTDWKWLTNGRIQRNFFSFGELAPKETYTNMIYSHPPLAVFYLELYTAHSGELIPREKPKKKPPKTEKPVSQQLELF